MDRLLILAALLLPLGGCFFDPPVTAPPLHVGLPCSLGPIILSPDDRLSRRTQEQIVAIDEAGARLCGWKPPHE